MGERGSLRTSTILIATARRTRVYRALEQVPPALRRKLVRSTSGSNAGTVLIADRRGARELLKASLGIALEPPAESSAGLFPLVRDDVRQVVRYLQAHWRALLATGALAAAASWVLAGLVRR